MALCFKGGLFLSLFVLISTLDTQAEASLSDYWKSLTNSFQEKEDSVNVQATDETCYVSGLQHVCQSAQLVKGTTIDYFHVCPKDGKSLRFFATAQILHETRTNQKTL